MKYLRSLFSVVALGVLSSALAVAQEDASPTPSGTLEPLPAGPLIHKRAPEFSQWLLTTTFYFHSAKGADKNAQPGRETSDKRLFTKTANLIRMEHMNEDRLLWTVWFLGKSQIMVLPGGKDCGELAQAINPDAVNANYTDVSKSDFSGFDWINAKNYIGARDYKGVKCLVFQARRTISEPGQPPTEVSSWAYIAAETRLPIALIENEKATIYVWKPAPQGMLTIPDIVSKLLAQQKEAARQIGQAALPPY
ncbi:MAG: hypothetical protein ACFUZC_16710 [Chthoniobacteraceae bacterium]